MSTEETTFDRIGVVGLGYVGLPLALVFVEAGYDVVGVDIDEERVSKLHGGESYVRDVTNDRVSRGTDSSFRPTSEYEALANCDAVMVCVPTPLRKSGQPDVSYVIDAAERLSDVIQRDGVVILESTVYLGATEENVVDRLAKNGWNVGEDVYMAFSPERIDPGNEEYGVTDIPKVIGGVTDSCGDRAASLYHSVFDEVVRVRGSTDAEFVKLLENTFRSVNIGMINELSLMAEKLDIDIWEAVDAAATKPFGFMPFYPGPGLGGHCIPIDPRHLSWKAKQQGLKTQFIDLADRVNREMPENVVNRVATLLKDEGIAMLDADILVLGGAFKPNVSDTREPPALDVIEHLRSRGESVQYHDPHVPAIETEKWRDESTRLTGEVLRTQDCVVFVTDHSAIDFVAVVEEAPRVFDTRNATAEFVGLEHVHRL